MLKNCLIIGFGNIGKKIFKELMDLEPDVVDKYIPEYNTININNTYKVGFVCVDTPLVNGELDVTEIKNAIKENRKRCNCFVVKSTVPVGYKIPQFGATRKVVFSPEYYGTTIHSARDFNFTILAGVKGSCEYVINTIQKCYDGSHKFVCVNTKEAQMAKFMENAFLATKVSFCNSFYEMCKKAGINYSTVRELFLLDPRMNPSHTLVYGEHPYWDSHCLNKDVPAIANQFDNEFLKGVIRYNDEQKKKYGYKNTSNDQTKEK